MQDAALVDRIDVQYRFMLEYVVFDEKLLSDTVSGANLNEDLNELFCVSLTEFNSNNTKHLNVEETKAKIASLKYIQDELAKGTK